ncbi:MAG: hypothetical protein KDD39_12895, partial [Bdellovibrionales bacterium]|nr:hypothetical protein [Bdellovibrionales bacterium]
MEEAVCQVWRAAAEDQQKHKVKPFAPQNQLLNKKSPPACVAGGDKACFKFDRFGDSMGTRN